MGMRDGGWGQGGGHEGVGMRDGHEGVGQGSRDGGWE